MVAATSLDSRKATSGEERDRSRLSISRGETRLRIESASLVDGSTGEHYSLEPGVDEATSILARKVAGTNLTSITQVERPEIRVPHTVASAEFSQQRQHVSAPIDPVRRQRLLHDELIARGRAIRSLRSDVDRDPIDELALELFGEVANSDRIATVLEDDAASE